MNALTHTQAGEPPIWTGWQNAVINGVYPLRQLLHGSEHSAVFLTERQGQSGAEAALKIVPIERVTLAQLSHWKAAFGLSHPHLLEQFDAGLCHLGGRQFLFVVMEYAHQTLSGVLAQRALTQDETLELLPPTLDALSFLHERGLVLAHLKPSNVLVVNDQLKLASDFIRPVGAPRVGMFEPSVYDPPESDRTAFSPADDIWALGVLLVETLTQRLPRVAEGAATVELPDGLPAAFASTVRRCLDPLPDARPSAAALAARLSNAGPESDVSRPEVLMPAAPATPTPAATQTVATSADVMHSHDASTNAPVVEPRPAAVAQAPAPIPLASAPKRSGLHPALTALLCVGLLSAVWLGVHRLHRSSDAAAPAAIVPEAAPPAVASSVAATPAVATRPTTRSPGSAAVFRSLPQVPRSALLSITGRVRVSVVAIVDRSGAVIETRVKDRGPSGYFAARAKDAAKKWKFTPTDQPGSRPWLIHFEFTRGGITARAAEAGGA